jgi:CRISPR-associated endoribonuclease Cas6
MLKERCIYSYVFETPPPSGTKMMTKYTAAPHPFIIEPPIEKRRGYSTADEIIFDLILIGKAIDYLPYFIYAFDELGNIGIGKGKAKYKLKNVKCGDDTVYDSGAKTIKAFSPDILSISLSKTDEQHSDIQALTLDFMTPVRMLFNNQLVVDMEFHILIRQLLRRLSLLYYFHCGGDPSTWDFKGIIEASKEIKVKSSNLKWYDWERYSARQDTRMKMGGLVGDITFEGDIEPFMPLIKAGEVLHLGKGTSFGLGKYNIVS